MSTFNSLGSNYDYTFAIKALVGGRKADLKEFIEKKYGGKATLLYKGREAITLALKSLNLPAGSRIAINGFTCYAVYKAIEEAGLKPVLIDIPKDDLNFSVQTLRENYDEKIRAVIVQNTLGYLCEIEEIAKFCKEKNIVLIEDLAHCVGAKYKNGKEAGTVGDLVAFSFSQDKIIDGVSGGALVTRNLKSQISNLKLTNPSFLRQIKDRFYPILTWKIRVTYDLAIGKPLHFLLKKLNLLSAPMDDLEYGLTSLPNFYQRLAKSAFENLEKNLAHRKKIAKIYKENLNKKIMFENLYKNIQSSSNLRFPIFVGNRNDLIKYLKDSGFYLSDIWYDAPIAPKRFMTKINYKNDCPNSEKISETIFNLPTHKNISETQALYLSKLINQWLKL